MEKKQTNILQAEDKICTHTSRYLLQACEGHVTTSDIQYLRPLVKVRQKVLDEKKKLHTKVGFSPFQLNTRRHNNRVADSML